MKPIVRSPYVAFPDNRRAFTLVEMLGVMVVIVLLISLTMPMVGSLKSAGGMNQAVLGVSLFLEQAHAHAMATNSHVWVGFHEDASKPSVSVAAVVGTSGAASDIGSTSNLRLIGKIQEYHHLRLANVASLQNLAGARGMASGEDVADSEITAFPAKRGGTQLMFSKVIHFTPNGGARIRENIVSRWIEVGLQPMNGSHANDKNVAALQVAGLTGQIRVLQP